MFAGAVNQAIVELWVINRRIKVPQPEALRLLSHKMRFLQGWFMFSPNPVMDDGTIVVDAITVDGRHIDPFTGGKPPNFDLIDAKSLGSTRSGATTSTASSCRGTGLPRRDEGVHVPAPRAHGQPERRDRLGRRLLGPGHEPEVERDKSWKFERNKLFSFENRPRGRQAANVERHPRSSWQTERRLVESAALHDGPVAQLGER